MLQRTSFQIVRRRCLKSPQNHIVCARKLLSSQAAAAATITQAQTATHTVFPSIVIGANGKLEPQGSFAEAQSQYLNPDQDIVTQLRKSLDEAEMGVVAHYYMDVELQAILNAVRQESNGAPTKIAIADSLAMGDAAVKMVEEAGVKSIACLGVDFMAESVSAILERSGHGDVPVYRADPRAIGCSLAESAERPAYRAWLQNALKQNNPNGLLHVVYINTSMDTKATSAATVPTITCTSSNVVKTMLQASAQVPGVRILYGPDTYMGENLVSLFDSICNSPETWDDARIARDLHPQHNRETLQRLRDSIDVFPNGNCVVHHMFGEEVVENVRQNYEDAFVTAHLEVPGEMFQIAMEKSMNQKGCVGSTSDILKFISAKVAEAASSNQSKSKSDRLKFILGTEAGMITSIVKSVEDILQQNDSNIEAEIIFPVASEAVTATDSSSEDNTDLAIVPGVSGGEGCSTAGGCATCPFMKMNDIDKLCDVVGMVRDSSSSSNSSKHELTLQSHAPPRRLQGKMLNGVSATDLGVQPILHMRKLMNEEQLSEDLVERMLQHRS